MSSSVISKLLAVMYVRACSSQMLVSCSSLIALFLKNHLGLDVVQTRRKRYLWLQLLPWDRLHLPSSPLIAL